MMRGPLGFCLTLAVVLLVACGEVITPELTTPEPMAQSQDAPQTPTRRSTATPPILPPAPTATPTLTPTPVVYIVREGDGLLRIAAEYEVSMEAIQEANGIENPQFLRVGQRLVIPVNEEEDNSTSGLQMPLLTPLPFEVQGVVFRDTPVGSLQFLGEVVNSTDVNLANVQVLVMLFDAQGQLQVEVDAFVAADLIPPDEKSPFSVLLVDPPNDWVNSQVTIVRGGAAGALANSYVPVAATEVQGQAAGSQFQLSGTVSNLSESRTAGSLWVIATTYDSEGGVTGFRREDVHLEAPFTPGASASFSVMLPFHGETPADFSVIAQGRVPNG